MRAFPRIRRGFTLVELMVVVVVIATLLAIMFRIVSVGSDSSHRNTTIARMQRIENALSGYFAAFGSYPPVALHAKRNVYAALDANGVQQDTGENGELQWSSVKEACKAQPIAARFPFPSDSKVSDYINTVSRIIVERINSSDDQWEAYRTDYARKTFGGGFTALNDPNQADGWQTKKDWADVKIFQFGVLSFLLPRYLFMTKGVDSEDLDDCAQWDANNRLSAHPNTGESFGNWSDQLRSQRLASRIPSQAVCARWMPNFEGILRGNPIKTTSSSSPMTFFGVNVSDGEMVVSPEKESVQQGSGLEVYLDQNRTILDSITALDGWEHEFYYYSPPPYQSYRLWSAGADGKTFPPWVPLDTLKTEADKKTASNWMADDIMYLSN